MNTGDAQKVGLSEIVVDILGTKDSPSRTIAAAGELVAADAIFNLWFARVAKNDATLSEDMLLEMVEGYEHVVEACATAWMAAKMKPSSEMEAVLLPVLRQSARQLRIYTAGADVDAIH